MVAPHTHGALSIRSTRRATCYVPSAFERIPMHQGVDLVFDGYAIKLWKSSALGCAPKRKISRSNAKPTGTRLPCEVRRLPEDGPGASAIVSLFRLMGRSVGSLVSAERAA